MGHNTVTSERSGAVLKATINDGDINLLNWKVMSDLNDLLDSIQDDAELKVLVFSSSNKDFFMAHLDLMPRAGVFITLLKNLSLMDEKYRLNPVLEAVLAASRKLFSKSTLPMMHPSHPTLAYFFGLIYRIRTLPLCTIALLNGRTRGGGNDLACACDMRFGIRSRTIIGAPEIAVGLAAAGGGARRMAEIMGSGRASEYLFSGRDMDAAEAEKCGMLNKAFDTEEEAQAYVDGLVERVGKFNIAAVRATKKILGDEKAILADFESDFVAAMALLENVETQKRMAAAMEMVKGGTRCEEELNLGEALMSLYD